MPAWRDVPGGPISLKARPGDHPAYLLPCGICIGCRTARAKEWAVRCALEDAVQRVTAFVTLTFHDDYVPVTLQRSDVSMFIKRFRAACGPVRFFASGEYGERNGRPHYHVLMFGVSPTNGAIGEGWRRWVCGARHVHSEARGCTARPLGFVSAEVANAARIAYTAGYCAKKIGDVPDPPGSVRVDESTGEVYRYQPPFIQMSRRPGIGGWAREHWRDFRTVASANGSVVRAPRFLHAAWKAKATPGEKAELEYEKFEKTIAAIEAGAVGSYHDRAGEAIALARHQRSAERRSV